MTDLIPNDLSHVSDEDFNALCPQGHHAPGPEPLSPAAQAVLRAAGDSEPGIYATIVAALRAAADQVVPPEQKTPWGSIVQAHAAELRIRNEFLAIAAELEGRHG